MKLRFFIAMVMTMLMAIIGLLMWSSGHEYTHYQVFKQMCSNAIVKIGFGDGAFMYTELVSAGDCDSNMQLANALNEVVGYQFGPLLAVIMATLSGLFTYVVLGDE
jgi:hypothetical protein